MSNFLNSNLVSESNPTDEFLREDYIREAIKVISSDAVARFSVPRMSLTQTVALICVLIDQRDYDIVEVGHYLKRFDWSYSMSTLDRLYAKHYGTDPFSSLWCKNQFGNLNLTFKIAA